MKLPKIGIMFVLLGLGVGCARPRVPAADPAATVATAFFQACKASDWEQAGRLYLGVLPAGIKERFAGLQLLDVGASFESPRTYDGRFVPYSVRLSTGTLVRKRLALKYGAEGWRVDGGL